MTEPAVCGLPFWHGETCILPPRHGGEFHVHFRETDHVGELVVWGPCTDGGPEGCGCPNDVYFGTTWGPDDLDGLSPVAAVVDMFLRAPDG